MPASDYAEMKGEERTKAMLSDLREAVGAVVASGQLRRWLDAMASNGLHRWSLNNRMLALMQLAERGEDLDGAHLAGFRQWQDLNRRVRKGEKAIWILAPTKRKLVEESEDGQKNERVIVTGFRAVPVFNISQTDGEALPPPPIAVAEGEATAGTLEGLRARVGTAGYSYREQEIPGCDPSLGTGTLGYTSPSGKEIVVDSHRSVELGELRHQLLAAAFDGSFGDGSVPGSSSVAAGFATTGFAAALDALTGLSSASTSNA